MLQLLHFGRLSGVSGGQWTQARRANVKQWNVTDLCQLCESATGTAAHRFTCPETLPLGGWPSPPAKAAAIGTISDDRKRHLKLRGVLAVRIHTPLRDKQGWFEWTLDPGLPEPDHQWYLDGSAVNPRWRSVATTGFGIVVVNGYGELIGYGRGAPPDWIRTAAAAEAWALLAA